MRRHSGTTSIGQGDGGQCRDGEVRGKASGVGVGAVSGLSGRELRGPIAACFNPTVVPMDWVRTRESGRREESDATDGGNLHQSPRERMGKARANEKEQELYSRSSSSCASWIATATATATAITSKWQLMRSKL